MRHMRQLVLPLLALLVLIGSAGCGTNPTTAPSPVASTATVASQTTALRFAIADDPRSFEPGLSVLMQDAQLALNLHAGLFTYNENSELVPYLVKSWEVSADGSTYTFVLRDDATWHSGKPITALDIKQGWERYLNPDLSAWGASYLSSIVGAKDIQDKQANELSGVEVVDEHTLRVRLSQPDPVFIYRLGAPPTWVVPAEAVVAGQPNWVSTPQGSGPFSFASWESKVKIVLQANPNFFGGKPALDQAEFLIVPDATTAFNLYQTGDLDIVAVPASELQRVRQDAQLSQQLQSWTKGQLIFIGLNQAKVEVFKDLRVRQAFDQAIDRRQISDKVLFGAFAPATGFVPPNVPGYNPELGSSYNPAQAKQLLADAGYPDGKDFPTITFAALGSSESTAAEAAAAQLRENLGINVEVVKPEPSEFYEGLRAKDKWDMFITGWTADFLSAEQWLYLLLHDGSATNFVGYANSELDAVVDQAMQSSDEVQRAELWREANRIATEDVAMIPFGYGQFTYLVKPGVTGFACNLFMPMGFGNVSRNQ